MELYGRVTAEQHSMKCSSNVKPLPVDVTLDTQMTQTAHSSLSLSDRYRRSYDSEFTAPLVMYHVWPALVEGNIVIVKGEAVTRRGALVLIS